MRLQHPILAVLSAALAFALAGCSDVDSTNLKTAGIRASLWVTADGTGSTEARAEFQVDDSALTFVTLKSGDQATASVAGQTKTLEESNLLGVVEYDARFDGQDAEGTTYSFALQRASDTSAPNSSATIPAPFSITSPSGTAPTYSRGNDAITVTYDNAGKGDVMTYDIDGGCIEPVWGVAFSDSGSFTVPKASIAKLTNGTTDTCQATLTVRRTRKGTLDPAFAGGSASGVQARSFTFTSTP